MRIVIIYFLSSLFLISSYSQTRVNKFAIFVPSNFYSYGEGQGSLNNVVRNSEAMAFRYTTYDTLKKKGMVYELLFNTVTGYYKNIISSNTILEVYDLHINANFILPMVIFYKKNMEHFLGTEIGIGALVFRDYLDENNTILPYNSSTLKELKFGKYWSSTFILDYNFDLKITKKIGFDLGLRYYTTIPFFEKAADYKVTQGTGISFKFGLSFQFK